MYPNRHTGNSHNQHNKLSPIDEHLSKVKEEYIQLQNQLQNSRLEIDKINQEKEVLQRQYMMYNELYMNLNIEVHKQAEIVKRFSALLSSVIPHLPVDYQSSTIQAAERAKQIAPQELQGILGNQMQQQQFAAASILPGMAHLGASMLANPAANFNPAMAFAAAGVKPEDANAFFNSLIKSSGGMPQMLAGLNAATATTSTVLNNSLNPGTSSASVPPIFDETRQSTNAPSRTTSSSAKPRSSAASPSNRGTPSASITPTLKRAKFEPEEIDGELEIDVQNDIDPTPSASQTNGNGNINNQINNNFKLHKDGRDSTHSTSSRDSTTPSARKLINTPNQNMLPIGDMNNYLFNPNRLLFNQFNQFPLMPNVQTNGTKPSYAFKIVDNGQQQPVTFPSDAGQGPDIPKNMHQVFELPHGDVVCSVTLSNNSSQVFTGAKGCVKIWDIQQGINTGKIEPSATLNCLSESYIRSTKLFNNDTNLIVAGESPTLSCYAIAISEDNKFCFACCADGKLIIWDLQNGIEITSLAGHEDGVSCVDLASDGEKIWTGGLDKTVRCWDIRAQEQTDKYSFSHQIFSLSCCPTDDYVVAGLENNDIEVLNTSKNEKYVLHDHEGCVLALKFAHSGKWFISSGKDNCLSTWRTPYGYRILKTKENASVLSCDISKDDKYIATGSGDKKATVYEVGF